MSTERPFDAWSLREAAEALLLVTAALETRLLQALERESTEEELADACGLDLRAVSVCLRALEEIGIVDRGARGFRPTAFGRSRFLDPTSPRYVAADLGLWRAGLRGWLFLEDVLRSGKPLAEAASPELRERLYRALDAKPSARVERLVERMLARSLVPRPHVLDVGGGVGTYARPFLARGCRVTLLDRAETIEHARQSYGLGRFRRLELVGGDFTKELPEGRFDAVLLADVIHDLSPAQAQALLARAARVCAPSGVLAVAEVLRGRSRRAAWFALTLMLYTAGGDTYSEQELTGWVLEAGFVEPETEDLDAGHALLTARRAGEASRRSG
jgi:ubiquinone/menaquinone biosynthesis C-methylase UbiE